jgi:phosphomannomutase
MVFAQTLTGFKWIVRGGGAAATDLVYGYEEALGYCVAPGHVRDKDGITAALLVAELAAGLKSEQRSLLDRLDELALEFGLYATDQLSIRMAELAAIDRAMAAVRGLPPTTLLDEPVTSIEDMAPEADVVVLRTPSARVVVRPSGTEPKLKAYLEIVEPVGAAAGGADVEAARERAAASLSALRTEVAAALGL